MTREGDARGAHFLHVYSTRPARRQLASPKANAVLGVAAQLVTTCIVSLPEGHTADDFSLSRVTLSLTACERKRY